MRTGFYIALCGAFITGAAFAAVSGRMELSISLALGALATLCIVYRTAVLPVKAIRTGMDLLKSQDFASRLRKVGNREADEIVDVFNRLMDTTKEERLHNREQNEFLSMLIEASPMGIAICDFEGNIRSSNPAFQSFCNLIPASTLATLQSGEQKVIRPTGSQVLRCSRHHFMDRGFKRPFYLVERLTDEIIQAETGMFHKIVRVMGHEVNNTLGGIASVLESLSDIHADDDLLHSAIEGSRASCVALGKFVKAYSDIVKTPEPVFENLCLADFASSEKPFLSSMCPPHIEFRTEISESGVCIQADPVLLERVMVNAVKNSIESISSRYGTKGRITLRTADRSIEIEDDGPGLSSDSAAKVFTPFFSTKNSGRGLGLMLIADILRKHRAEYSLASRNGKTTFCIKFQFSHNQM